MDRDPEFPIPTRREQEALRVYLRKESEFMAVENFFENHRNMQIRKNAVHTIFRLSQGGNLDAFVPYLAMNYFDRFVSRHCLPNVEADDAENVRLLALCCLTIASKMRTKSFSVTLFLRAKFLDIAHAKIMRTEFSILAGLDWRMRPITAFSFLNHFYPRYKQIGGFKRRCINEIIVQSQGERSFTRYLPSVIALSSFLAATYIAYPSRYSTFDIPEEARTCVSELIELCQKKNIEIERALSRSVHSPRIPAAIHDGQPEEAAAADTGSSQQRPGKAVVVEDDAGVSASGILPAAIRDEQPEEVAAAETKSNQQRPGKAVVVADSEIVPAAEAEPKKPLNFELRWVTDEAEDLNIPPLVTHDTSATQGSPDAPTREVSNARGRDASDSFQICGCNCDLLAYIFSGCCNSCRSASSTPNDDTHN